MSLASLIAASPNRVFSIITTDCEGIRDAFPNAVVSTDAGGQREPLDLAGVNAETVVIFEFHRALTPFAMSDVIAQIVQTNTRFKGKVLLVQPLVLPGYAPDAAVHHHFSQIVSEWA